MYSTVARRVLIISFICDPFFMCLNMLIISRKLGSIQWNLLRQEVHTDVYNITVGFNMSLYLDHLISDPPSIQVYLFMSLVSSNCPALIVIMLSFLLCDHCFNFFVFFPVHLLHGTPLFGIFILSTFVIHSKEFSLSHL